MSVHDICVNKNYKNEMKNKKIGIKLMLAIATIALLATSCKKKGCDDPNAENYDSKAKKNDGSCVYINTDITGNISSNTTWSSDKVWNITGKVIVKSGSTLTIEAGTIVKATEGTDVNAAALIVERGAKINASGTASSPIIFTSVLDNIEIGQTTGSNLNESHKGKWGGIILLGRAPVSAADGDTEGQIEGIPATETYGTFGGSSSADNSGTMKYVSIRHGGALIGSGNEINGLTLGGVGSGTIIENIEVLGNVDDGVEFFGGTVNVKNVLVSYQGDDAIDIDMNYAGTVDNFMIVHGGENTDEGLEIDGPEGTTNTTGLFTLKNGTVKSIDGQGSAGDFKSKAQGTIQNVKFTGYTSAKVKIRASYQNDCVDAKTDSFTHLTDASPSLTFTTTEFDAVSVYTKSTDNAGTTDCTVQSADQTAAESVMTSSIATGTTADYSWTWTSIKGKL